jgi:hypothetical protein
MNKNKINNETYGWVTQEQLDVYRAYGVSVYEHNYLEDRYGFASSIIEHVKRNSLGGRYVPA